MDRLAAAGVVLRAARAADLPAVLQLVRELATFEQLPGPDEDAAQRFAADFARQRFGLWVADASGEVAGYALHFMTYSTFLARPSLYLEDLYVRPERRRLGIASGLLRALARHANELGCGRFEWTVLDWNEPAQAFYRSLGAEVLPDWRVCRVSGEALVALANASATSRAE
jgi:GNAT superfamily N-acetyltransferase